MSSFGEALVSSFNQTFQTVTAARLSNERAATMRQEREGNQRQQEETRASQIRNGLLNPDGTTNDPNGNAQRAQLPAPTAAPIPAPDATLTSAPPAPAAPAPTQAPAPSPLGGGAPPVLTPAGQQAAAAGAQAGAGSPHPAMAGAAAGAATAPAAPAQAPQGGSPRGLVAQQDAAAGQAPQPGGAAQGQTFQPNVPQSVVQQAAREVEAGGNQPVDAMVVSTHTIPDPARGPGGRGAQAEAAQYAQPLVQEIVQNRGDSASGPLTRADWNAYLRDVTLASQRNLTPAQQVQALAVVDRIRTAGLQRFTALAVAAAQAGDMQGAARALNGASNFNPDGFQDQFTPTQGGIQMRRTPEAGVNGSPVDVTVPAADVVRYATAMLDPTWSLNHFLAVRRQDETERHNQRSEGLQAASIGEAAAGRREARNARNEERAGNAAYVRAEARVADAEDTLSRLGPNASAADRTAAQEAVTAARAARREALANAGESGVRTAAGMQAQRAADADRDRAAEDRRNGRAPLTEGEATRLDNAGANLPQTASGRWAAANLQEVYSANRGQRPDVLADVLQRFYTSAPENIRRNPPARIVDEETGLSIQMPRRAGSRPGTPPAGAANPAAPTDSGGPASMGGARTPPSSGGGLSSLRPPIATTTEAPVGRAQAQADRAARDTERTRRTAEARQAFETRREELLQRAGVRRIEDLPIPDRRALLNNHPGVLTTAERRALTR